MNTDIRIAVGFFDHPKTIKLQRRCGWEGVISLQRLWVWASQERPSGDLSGMDIEDIEIAAKWGGEPGAFFEAIKDRFIDLKDDKSIHLHDWAEINTWAASSEERSDKGRLSRLKGLHPEVYRILTEGGLQGIDKEAYAVITTAKDKLKAAQGVLKVPLSEPITPTPTPMPIPTPKVDTPPTPPVGDEFKEVLSLYGEVSRCLTPNANTVRELRDIAAKHPIEAIRLAFADMSSTGARKISKLREYLEANSREEPEFDHPSFRPAPDPMAPL